MLVLLQPLCFYVILKLNKKILIWILNMVILVSNIYFKTYSFSKNHMFSFSDIEHYMIMLMLSWINLRCLSFCIDNINRSFHLLNFLSYCLYLPSVCLGPYMPYNDFKRSHEQCRDNLINRLLKLLLNLIRFGFWIVFTEFCLHFFYVSALSYQVQLVKKLSNSALYGYGYCMGQFFHLKYVVFYGLSTSMARFENIEAPSTPKCIGRIHLYSDMWKYFDEGLYKFLLKYIYLPTLNNSVKWNKLFSSFLCFIFVYVWHGIEYHILIWISFNYFGICIEHLIKYLFSTRCMSIFSDRWRHHILCTMYSPLLALSAISNFYFFSNTEIGYIFIERVSTSNTAANLILLFSLYCCCHVSIGVKKWEQGKHK
ncbi:hypothetical protein FQA39_LY03464 [Lamprigera yunnana]|nr:hypothetical protein FQA39_LY03464 [Lamprigera yunnana]